MERCKNTISLPVWIYDQGIYVPTVDIPIGIWRLILHLTPVETAGATFELEGWVIAKVQIKQSKNLAIMHSAPRHGGIGWQITLENSFEGEKKPQPTRYTIELRHPSSGQTRRFDPVVVAQPDPIYP